jgi:phosphate transport system substrate-binding protein
MRKITLAVAVGALVALAAPAAASASTTLIGSGSTAAEPVLRPLFSTYQKVTKGKVHFLYTANGGNAGVADVQSGKSQFAGQARPPLPSDAGTTYVKLYLDGLCIDVNPANHLTNISIPQVADIFHAVTTNWSQVSGSNLTTTIDPVGRDTNGGTYNFFLQGVLNNQAPSSKVNAQPSDGLVQQQVKGDANAIGYTGLAYQGAGSGQKALSLNGVPCTAKQVRKLTYPLSRFIFLVFPTNGANPAVQRFADWVRTSPVAGKVIAKAGGVPAFNRTSTKKKKK